MAAIGEKDFIRKQIKGSNRMIKEDQVGEWVNHGEVIEGRSLIVFALSLKISSEWPPKV